MTIARHFAEALAMKRSILMLAGLAGFLALALVAAPVNAQDDSHGADVATPHYPIEKPNLEAWTFAGFFGHFDQAQLQRGFQVYREVCSACHGLELVAFRNLGAEGGPHFSEAEIRALAAEYDIADGPNDTGEMFERPGRPSDYLPNPFANPQTAASVFGAAPPDLSVMAKARGVSHGMLRTLADFFTQYQEAGPDYIHSLLTGYSDPPEGVEISDTNFYNPYFIAGPSLAMSPPLSAEIVSYSDGSPETVDQYSRDVTAFLMWAAEPHLVERKRIGFQVVLFLIVFAGLMYFTKKKVWSSVKH